MPDPALRKHWMEVLAKAPPEALSERFSALDSAPGFTWLRAPETGSIMVRGRAGGTGAAFNLGEMTVTRCTLTLEDGTVGHAYIAGRDGEKARIAAQCDALMQGSRADEVRRRIIAPLEAEAAARKASITAEAEATRVDFFTMVRGEN